VTYTFRFTGADGIDSLHHQDVRDDAGDVVEDMTTSSRRFTAATNKRAGDRRGSSRLT
jgi:hypothetical protein